MFGLCQGEQVLPYKAIYVLCRNSRLRLLGRGLSFGQREQLIQQVATAFDPPSQRDETFTPLFRHLGLGQSLSLQRQSSQGGPQFVCGIRDKSALRFHRLVNAGKHTINCHHDPLCQYDMLHPPVPI